VKRARYLSDPDPELGAFFVEEPWVVAQAVRQQVDHPRWWCRPEARALWATVVVTLVCPTVLREDLARLTLLDELLKV
jgi:hypothetical protein